MFCTLLLDSYVCFDKLDAGRVCGIYIVCMLVLVVTYAYSFVQISGVVILVYNLFVIVSFQFVVCLLLL